MVGYTSAIKDSNVSDVAIASNASEDLLILELSVDCHSWDEEGGPAK